MSPGDIPPLSHSSRLSRLTRLSRHSSKKSKESKSSTPRPSGDQPQDDYEPSPNPPSSGLTSERGVEDQVDGQLDGQLDGEVDGQVNDQANGEANGELELGAPKSDDGFDSPPMEQKETATGNTHWQQENGVEQKPQDDPDDQGYDLKPPPPKLSHSNIETVASRFFSADHLDLILRDPNHAARLRRFLDTYMPQHASAVVRYVELRKAFAAVEYANAITQQLPKESNNQPFLAANYDDAFGTSLKEIAEALVEEALPSYLTNCLVSIVTESLVKDIAGKNAPFMKELVPNLAEVYCIADPSLEDSPIVYASEEFHNTTQYGRDYVLGRNCRFLQGPETSKTTVERIKDAIKAGEETCDMILNYRRDGSPFLNLLMLAPLYDSNGEVRYFLGSQIDVTALIDNGRGLDSFAQLLVQDRSESLIYGKAERDTFASLGELGEMLNEPEANFLGDRLKDRGQRTSRSPESSRKHPHSRRVLSMDEDTPAMGSLWPDQSLGHSGRLPGVYRNYILVRPYPSLRITFASPSLQIPGLMQTKLLDRVGGNEQVRQGLVDALSNDTSVTAKITWLNSNDKNGEDKYVAEGDGKPRWIHCTPLLGSDEKVGVWMIVIVEEDEVTGILNRQESTASSRSATPMRLGEVGRTATGNEMYSDYLKGERNGRPQTSDTQRTDSSMREGREVDDQFRDF